MTISKPTDVKKSLNWMYLGPTLLIHSLALLAFIPELFSWTGVVLVFVGNFVFGSLGVNLCYHRLLTHKGLTVPKKLEHFLATLGVLSLQSTPLVWTAIHRLHHRHSDKPEDPHSPKAGFWWGHMGWVFHDKEGIEEQVVKMCPDLMRDRFYKRLERKGAVRKLWLIHVALFFGISFIYEGIVTGNLIAALTFATSVVVWGVFVRTIYVWHITYAVNSLSHTFGYRNYETNDDSRNNWLVALVCNGEGWHNNHHQDQRSCKAGHRWFEFDVTYYVIWLMEKSGYATKIVRPKASKYVKDVTNATPATAT
jgi:fatty-acid desaturase